MFIAALDTCVLYPSLQRDLLLSLASERLFRPVWSDITLEELRYHERRKLIQRVGLPEEEAAHRSSNLILTLANAFTESKIETSGRGCPDGISDPNDWHVIEAADRAQANVIVTENHKDFPQNVLSPYGLRTLSASDFIADTVDVSIERAYRALLTMLDRRVNPSMSVEECCDILVQRYKLDDAVSLLLQEHKKRNRHPRP